MTEQIADYSSIQIVNNQEFVEVHKTGYYTPTGIYRVLYHPNDEVHSDFNWIQMQQVMKYAANTGNLNLLTYIVSEYGNKVFEEKYEIQDRIYGQRLFTNVLWVGGSRAITCLNYLYKECKLNLCYRDGKLSKYNGSLILEQAFYQAIRTGDIEVINWIIDTFNTEMIKHSFTDTYPTGLTYPVPRVVELIPNTNYTFQLVLDSGIVIDTGKDAFNFIFK